MRFTTTTLCKVVLSLAVLLVASAPLALAQGTYTQLDYPGAYSTTALGINAAGDIVGYYEAVQYGKAAGFLLSGGTYTLINYPGAADTFVVGINDNGRAVGFSTNPDRAFVFDTQTQTFAEIKYPGSTTAFPSAINNAGTVVGSINMNDNSDEGFELVSGGHGRLFSPVGATYTWVNGITESGVVVGDSQAANNTFASFSFDKGKYQRLVIPASNAIVLGVNPAGTALVGVSFPAGFIYENKTLTTLEFPGSNYTYALGINNAGEVTGYFDDANNVWHGFTWTPPADAGKK
jgi:probable HAF family extracellular repeat protein